MSSGIELKRTDSFDNQKSELEFKVARSMSGEVCICHNYNCTGNIISDILNINNLYLVNVKLVNLVHLWRESGLALGMKPLTLEIIRSNNLKDVECRFTEVLAAWLSGEDRPHDSPGPRWVEVIAALDQVPINQYERTGTSARAEVG